MITVKTQRQLDRVMGTEKRVDPIEGLTQQVADTKAVVDDVSKGMAENVKITREIAVMIMRKIALMIDAKPAPVEPKARHWTFTVERDEKGLITEINATSDE